MSSEKCPRCGAEMHHVALNYLGYDDNGHHYECPECDYSEYIKPTHKSPKHKSDPLEYIDAAKEHARTERMDVPHIYGGTIVGVNFEGDETIIQVELDHPEEPIRYTHVCIIDAEQVFV